MGLMLRKWNFPEDMPRLSPTFQSELTALLDHLPEGVRTFLLGTFGERLFQLSEIYMQIGQPCEAVFQNDQGITERVDMGVGRCTREMIQLFSDLFRNVQDVLRSKRRGISGTLHRISLITHPNQSVIGVNIRVGRSFEGTLNRMIGPNGLYDLLQHATGGTGKLSSLLIIGRPGCGKTTVLREIAATLANDREKIVIVIDKTNEIAGDGESPHGCIGLARWMPVGDPTKQHEVMIEAVENQNPHILIVDEISNAAEVAAAKSIAQRGVTLIATVHGKTLPELISCGDRRALVGSSVSGKSSMHCIPWLLEIVLLIH
jgi:stage III sporulation protein SpoIIIAA